jgi:hypothetical protein
MAEPSMAEREDPGFLSRWSQRKQAVREGQLVQEPVKPSVVLPDAFLEEKALLPGIKSSVLATNSVANDSHGDSDSDSENGSKLSRQAAAQEVPPPPTLEEAKLLTPESDFKPFMRADVQPEVKNAAMKALFKDPHFNTMDMMDVYVDDYSKPDPLPPEMLRKMAVTQFLGFWKEEEEEEKKKKEQAREDAKPEGAQTVAQSASKDNLAPSQEALAAQTQQPALSQHHDHSDLRLQPDDATRRESDRQRAG